MTKTTAQDVKRARIEIEIDGAGVTLIPSPDAILFLSNKYGGFQPLLASLQALNVQASVDVVVAGMGAEGKAAKDISKSVIAQGIIDLLPKLIEFVMILANGGKPIKEKAEGEDEDSDPSR